MINILTHLAAYFLGALTIIFCVASKEGDK